MKTTHSLLKKMRNLLLLMGIVLTLSIPGVFAATVIHYDGINQSYTGGQRAYWGGVKDPVFQLPGYVDNGTVRTFKYSDTQEISPSTGYTGPKIYAALQNDTHDTASGLANSSGIRSGSLTYNDNVDSGFVLVGAGNGSTITTMVFFQTDDMLEGKITFDAASSITMIGKNGTGGGPHDMRFVVQSNGQWYISNTITAGTGPNLPNKVDSGAAALVTNEWSLDNLDSYSFASFNPKNAAPLPVAPVSGFNTLGSSFTDITAVGYYFTSTGPSNNTPWVSLFDFEVVAVPEPSSKLLVLIGSFLAFFGLRMRRRGI